VIIKENAAPRKYLIMATPRKRKKKSISGGTIESLRLYKRCCGC
jgi:hypothetical protein